MYFITEFYEGWRDLMDNKSDPRTKDWPLMSSPFPTIAICLSYAYFVKVIGPRLMEDRKPFKLREILILYNFIQVIFSTWLFYQACVSGWLTTYSYRCQPVDYSRSPLAMQMASGSWWYYFSKFTEFLDTIFFVMRKRYDQVSTLHVIHHGIMPASVWWGVKFTPGGHSSFFGFLNTFVHIIMYTYYMLAAIGPHMQKYLWWKKYLTVLQMVQFVLVMLHAFQLLIKNDCNYPIYFAYFIGAHAVLFYFLFSNFYKQAYTKKIKTIKTTDDNKKESTAVTSSSSNGSIKNNTKDSNGTTAHKSTNLYENIDNNNVIKNSYSETKHRAFVGAESNSS